MNECSAGVCKEDVADLVTMCKLGKMPIVLLIWGMTVSIVIFEVSKALESFNFEVITTCGFKVVNDAVFVVGVGEDGSGGGCNGCVDNVITITSGFAVVAVLDLNVVAIEVSFVGVPAVCVGAFCSIVDEVCKSVNDTGPIKGICGFTKE